MSPWRRQAGVGRRTDFFGGKRQIVHDAASEPAGVLARSLRVGNDQRARQPGRGKLHGTSGTAAAVLPSDPADVSGWKVGWPGGRRTVAASIKLAARPRKTCACSYKINSKQENICGCDAVWCGAVYVVACCALSLDGKTSAGTSCRDQIQIAGNMFGGLRLGGRVRAFLRHGHAKAARVLKLQRCSSPPKPPTI